MKKNVGIVYKIIVYYMNLSKLYKQMKSNQERILI